MRCGLVVMLLAGGLSFDSLANGYSSGGAHSYSSSSHSSSSFGSSSSGHSFSSSSHSFSSGSSSFGSSGGSSHSSSSPGFSSGGHSFSSGSSGLGSSGSSSHSVAPASSSGSSHSWAMPSPSARSSSSETSRTFNSGSGQSYSSSSTWSDTGRHSYSSGKSYTSDSGHTFASTFGNDDARPAAPPARSRQPEGRDSGISFDAAAARAQQEEASKAEFNRFKESQTRPAPLPARSSTWSSPTRYTPDTDVMVSRPARVYHVFSGYATRPVVIYRDPYDSLFWWWLLDRPLEDRAWWAYHHRYDMDPARYQALVANDQQLQARVEQLEAQQAPRDPNYTPPDLKPDLMYTDHYVAQAYSNRPTVAGAVAFWVLGIPAALAVSGFFIWLVWFKRWQPAT